MEPHTRVHGHSLTASADTYSTCCVETRQRRARCRWVFLARLCSHLREMTGDNDPSHGVILNCTATRAFAKPLHVIGLSLLSDGRRPNPLKRPANRNAMGL